MGDPNAQYNVAAPDSLPVRLAAFQRRRMYEVFLARCGLPDLESTILDVGATSDRTYSASNYVEAWYPHKDRITAAGIDDARFLEELYPGLRFVAADACDMPFEDCAFDVVHASAVIEHVGAFARQVRMIAECARVARRAFFITTPNRWFPIEFHTVLPLIHWLPKPIFRAAMRRTGRDFFAREENLNLLTAGELRSASEELDGYDVTLEAVSLGLWPSNLLLSGCRR